MASIPAPPPLPPSIKRMEGIIDKRQHEDNAQLLDHEIEAEKVWRRRINKPCKSIYCLTPVRPVLQSGPTCGLVALAMALQGLGIECEVGNILSAGRSLHFTRQGEMMSVQNMKVLCEKLFPATASLVTGIRSHVSLLVQHLARGFPVILPYDCDANHEPAARKGQRAHWALLSGFLLTFPDDADDRLVRWSTPLPPAQRQAVLSHTATDSSSLFLFARQGKSRHMQVWSFDDLCASSENLIQMSDKLSSETHVVPHDGDLSLSLADQMLLIEGMVSRT